MDAKEMKEAIIDFVENVNDEGLDKLWEFIFNNFEVEVTDYDREQLK
ncbi:hypothetical protein [Desulfosporosinus nitroreducens]|uniref:Uncharacterized protein n=1 Tax=Desulfosporosinus nitroreducens TaxID=2018668 RepID=A0ABT8QR90_9FIRM|nr:hypothetical protein [Desulfosporosinus nitroreducens]MDO0823094.1 hypothetical protein [Desulfosporosinus nitroreducens]